MARPTQQITQLSQYSQGVKDLRAAHSMSQQQFSNMLGMPINTIARYETGRAPDAASMVQLARAARSKGHERLARLFLDGAALYIGAKEVTI